jgi:hypothetical protein
VIAIKDAAEFYTLQWAERGIAAPAALAADDSRWRGRLQQLAPIILCPKQPGEAPPYPSCADQK